MAWVLRALKAVRTFFFITTVHLLYMGAGIAAVLLGSPTIDNETMPVVRYIWMTLLVLGSALVLWGLLHRRRNTQVIGHTAQSFAMSAYGLALLVAQGSRGVVIGLVCFAASASLVTRAVQLWWGRQGAWGERTDDTRDALLVRRSRPEHLQRLGAGARCTRSDCDWGDHLAPGEEGQDVLLRASLEYIRLCALANGEQLGASVDHDDQLERGEEQAVGEGPSEGASPAGEGPDGDRHPEGRG